VIYGLPTGWLGTEVATFSIQDTPSRLRRSRFCFGRGCGSFTHSSSSTTDGAAIFELGSIWHSTKLRIAERERNSNGSHASVFVVTLIFYVEW
jgi:hypothetical protein